MQHVPLKEYWFLRIIFCHLIYQVFLGHSGGLDTEGNELPRLVYVSREKRPGFQHHKKAGAMNALVSTSMHDLAYICEFGMYLY